MEIFLAILMLSLSFFFSGIEIAFLSASRLKIELKTLQGDTSAKILSNFTKNTSRVLITILIGNNLALVVFTTLMEGINQPWIEQTLGLSDTSNFLVYTALQAVISTLMVLVLAEYIPKAIFRSNADRMVFPSAYILQFFYFLLYIPVYLVNVISRFLLKVLFRVPAGEHVVELDREDLEYYIQEVIEGGEESVSPDLDKEMLTNALAFRETKTRECMIPRTEMIALSLDCSLDELIDTFIESQLSKVVIYQENLDDVKGFVHSSAMFQKTEEITQLIQPVLFVPETMPANLLLAELKENQRSMAIVVDEFGGTAGMVTMEDLVEEVFGEIEDEYDTEKPEEIEPDEVKVKHPDGSFTFGARLEIDDLNEEFGLVLPEEEYYTTLGGLIMYVAEHIPLPEEKIQVGEYLFTVLEGANNRVISLKMQIQPKEEE
ncbi:hemolysin family protein [Pontibacter sp. G13]|uniref:hemolysin family protein n=1 Tax=Pontibacter sp. G13 TaxID=3074898 RepID=UPI0028893042|nr:hemolysin family protein [Pontibacter sp. G13]WNJ21270.1 hemolysin family protein [Pontibacter sp. G13]